MSGGDDISLPFQVEHCDIRGRLVRLGPALDSVLERHGYPETVGRLLAEAMALAAVMATALTFEGIFTLQAKGDGPISLLVADHRSPGHIRAYASFDAEKLAALKPGEQSLGALLGKGYLAFTIDPISGDMERYQGIVDLTGPTLADAAHAYFAQSEQLAARLSLGAEHVRLQDGRRQWRAGALLIQQFPAKEGGLSPEDRADAWDRARSLLSTTTRQELTDPNLPANDLLYRLFHEDGVRVFPTLPLAAQCTCSREKLMGVFANFTASDIAEMAVDGVIEAQCEFCSERYRFTPESLSGRA